MVYSQTPFTPLKKHHWATSYLTYGSHGWPSILTQASHAKGPQSSYEKRILLVTIVRWVELPPPAGTFCTLVGYMTIQVNNKGWISAWVSPITLSQLIQMPTYAKTVCPAHYSYSPHWREYFPLLQWLGWFGGTKSILMHYCIFFTSIWGYIWNNTTSYGTNQHQPY